MTKLTDVLEYIDSCSDKQWLKFCECMENRGYIIEGKYLHDYDYPHVIRCKDCRWGREVCGNIECWTDMNQPPEYHGYDWYCPNGERKEE